MMLAVSLVIGNCLTDILSSFIDDFVMNKLDTSIIRHNHSNHRCLFCGPLLVLNTTENQLRPAAQHDTTKSHSTLFAQFSYRFGPVFYLFATIQKTTYYLLFFFLILHALYTLIIFRLCSQMLKDRLHSRLTGYASPGAA